MKRIIGIVVTCATVVAGLLVPNSHVSAQSAHRQAASANWTALKGKTIGITEPDIFGPFFVNILYGAEQEAHKHGIKLIIYDAGGYSNIDKQISQMETLIAKHVDAIFVDPADPKAFGPVVAKAKKAKIPVFGFGDPVSGAVSSVYGAHYKIGAAVANYFGHTLKSGDVVAEAGPAGATWTTIRYNGFTTTLKKYPGLHLRATQWSDPARIQGVQLTEDFLTRFPTLKGVYAADNSIGEGAGDAVAARHLQKQVSVATAVMSTDTRRMIRSGAIKFDVAMQVVLFGRIAVRNAIKVWKHKSVQKNVVPALVNVTKANVNRVKYATMMAPPSFKP
jgi:ABC-type sugar transport system substrate-binding protein